MLPRLVMILALLIPIRGLAQVNEPPGGNESSQTSDAANAAATRMLLPPPVSGLTYPTAVESETRSNYLRGGLTFSGGYVNNLYPGIVSGTSVTNDALYMIQPSLSLDYSTPRSHEVLSYTPSISFYQPDSVLNTTNHSVMGTYQYRLGPHLTFLAGDNLEKTSTTLTQPTGVGPGSVSGNLPSVTPGVVVPFAPQVSNDANVVLAWQFSPGNMVGAGGTATLLNFSNPVQAQGLFNSNARGGSGFYTHRLNGSQYMGAAYQYSTIIASPFTGVHVPSSDLQTNSILGFYTLYLSPRVSFSVGAGPQRYDLTQGSIAPVRTWAPAVFASLGGQGRYASFAASYSHEVTGGEGVVGAFTSDAVEMSTRWEILPTWTIGLGGGYSRIKTVSTRILAGGVPGGHTISGMASVEHRLSDALSFTVQYQRLHQNYQGISTITANPDSNYEFGSLTYHFSKGLGR